MDDPSTSSKELQIAKRFEDLFDKALNQQDKILFDEIYARHYRQWTKGGIEQVDFQQRAVASCISSEAPIWSAEMATGSGKTVVAALLALQYLKKGGSIIYICPNDTALGDENQGIVNKFHKTFGSAAEKYRIGRVNEASRLFDVLFFTPGKLVSLHDSHKGLFDRIFSGASLLIVDEAHHFPVDRDKKLKIFGKVLRWAIRYFVSRKKKVLTLTATHGRMDGRIVMDVKEPHFKFTVQDAVNSGRCPEVHGIERYLSVTAPRAKRTGDFYDLRLSGTRYSNYWRLVAGDMLKMWTRWHKPMAAFVRLVKEARYLVRCFNASAGGPKLAVLTGDTPKKERRDIISAVNSGKLVGYVTCDVGSEALDIPPLEIVLLVRNSRSANRNAQAIGRALRMAPRKNRALVIFYFPMQAQVIQSCKGLLEYGEAVRIEKFDFKPVAGGPIIPIPGRPFARIDGDGLEETKALVIKMSREPRPMDIKREVLLTLARSGAPRPSDKSVGNLGGFTFEQLAHAYYRLTSPHSEYHDPSFMEQLNRIPGVHDTWVRKRAEMMAEIEIALRNRAEAGWERPDRDKEPQEAQCLESWTQKGHARYKPELDAFLRSKMPSWFRKGRTASSFTAVETTPTQNLPSPGTSKDFIAWVAEFVLELPLIARQMGLSSPLRAARYLKRAQSFPAKSLAAEFVRDTVVLCAKEVYENWLLRGMKTDGIQKEISDMLSKTTEVTGIDDPDEIPVAPVEERSMESSRSREEFHLFKAGVAIQFMKIPIIAHQMGARDYRGIIDYFYVDGQDALSRPIRFVHDLFRLKMPAFAAKWMGNIGRDLSELRPHFSGKAAEAIS